MEKVVKKIMHTFISHGFQIYLVGGYVRDFLLGVPSHDIDLATDALPEQIEKLFPQTLALGAVFGTITIIEAGVCYEVTTFREDSRLGNHRKPEHVSYTDSLCVDVQRRDLTINGLAMDVNGQIFDYVNGQADLAAGIIRTIGISTMRFEEDALRILRTIRFASRFQFQIEDKTFEAVASCADKLNFVSKERIRQEWSAIISQGVKQPLCVPTEVGEVCFGADWQAVIRLIEQGYEEMVVFTYLRLTSTSEWRYTKKEHICAKHVEQRKELPIATRYLGLNLVDAYQLEQMLHLVTQTEFQADAFQTRYEQLIIHRVSDVAIHATQLQALGFEGSAIGRGLFACAQAINEAKIENTVLACQAYLEEEQSWKKS